MAETNRSTALGLSQPPPAPPLPPQKPSVLQRFIPNLPFGRPQRQQGTPIAQSASASPKDVAPDRPYRYGVGSIECLKCVADSDLGALPHEMPSIALVYPYPRSTSMIKAHTPFLQEEIF